MGPQQGLRRAALFLQAPGYFRKTFTAPTGLVPKIGAVAKRTHQPKVHWRSRVWVIRKGERNS